MSALSLPPGLTTRPLSLADAPAAFAVTAEQERHDLGGVEVEEADLLSDWQRPSYDLGASSVAVLDGDRVVAYAVVPGAGVGLLGLLVALVLLLG